MSLPSDLIKDLYLCNIKYEESIWFPQGGLHKLESKSLIQMGNDTRQQYLDGLIYVRMMTDEHIFLFSLKSHLCIILKNYVPENLILNFCLSTLRHILFIVYLSNTLSIFLQLAVLLQAYH
jgi:hypothetical protein